MRHLRVIAAVMLAIIVAPHVMANDIPANERRSGATFMTPQTQAIQNDDFDGAVDSLSDLIEQNPGNGPLLDYFIFILFIYFLFLLFEFFFLKNRLRKVASRSRN